VDAAGWVTGWAGCVWPAEWLFGDGGAVRLVQWRRRQGSEGGRVASLLAAGLKCVCQGGGPAASLTGHG